MWRGTCRGAARIGDRYGQAAEPRIAAQSRASSIYDPGDATSSNAVSADGSEVFVTTCIEGGQPEKEEPDHQLFVRLGGARTVEVSRPLKEVCGQSQLPCPGAAARAGANYAGASEDGSKVFFTTTAPLRQH